MTAKMAGKAAVEEFWGTLRNLKEQWVLFVFLTGALFWARDTFDEFAKLPDLVRQQMESLAELDAAVKRLASEMAQKQGENYAPVFGFPGTQHSIDDGMPGAWTVIRWSPIRRLRGECTPSRIDAFMVDRGGQWFSAETAMAPMPAVEADAELAFGVRVPPRMLPGRAKAGVQITSVCGVNVQVETAPWLQFRVLDG